MKKHLTHLTGIVFVIAILLAAASCAAPGNESLTYTDPEDPKVVLSMDTVTIYLQKAYEDDNGGKHLRMYDSHNSTIVVDDLETLVLPGTVVIWEVQNGSEIRKLKKISIKDGSNGNVLHKDASGFFYTLFTGNKKHIVPVNAPRPSEDKYLIKFKHDKGGKSWVIDPYLKIPPR